MSISTCVILLAKTAESQFEFTDFEKTRFKGANRTDHTRPKLTAKAPLQRNYSSNQDCSTSYIWVGPASGEHPGFGIRLWASKSGLNSEF